MLVAGQGIANAAADEWMRHPVGLVRLGVVHVEAPGLAATAKAPRHIGRGAFVSTASSDGSLIRDNI